MTGQVGSTADGPARRRTTVSTRTLVVIGLLVAVALAFVVAPRAASDPDGLERVAADHELDTGQREHALSDSPLADYGVVGVDHEALGTGLAGLAGIAVTFTIATAAVVLVPRLRGRRAPGDIARPSV